MTRDGDWLVGMGMAAAIRGNPLRPSSASVTLGSDGVLTCRMAMTDIGTGTYTIMTQIAAEMIFEARATRHAQATDQGTRQVWGAVPSGHKVLITALRIARQARSEHARWTRS